MSVDPLELKQMVIDIRSAESAMGTSTKVVIESEKKAHAFARRSVVAKTFISKGTIITPNDITCKRPGTGIAPKYIDLFIGRVAKKDIPADKLLTFEMI